jgi:NitT/TauT family transport system ATP-binding protein
MLGPSGCGKSTILRLAAGLEVPTSGEVLYDGQSLKGPGRRRGFVFQSYNCFSWVTVRGNVAFGLNDSECDNNKKKIQNWLDFNGLIDFAEAYLAGQFCMKKWWMA